MRVDAIVTRDDTAKTVVQVVARKS
jgi:hypothetical protein